MQHNSTNGSVWVDVLLVPVFVGASFCLVGLLVSAKTLPLVQIVARKCRVADENMGTCSPTVFWGLRFCNPTPLSGLRVFQPNNPD